MLQELERVAEELSVKVTYETLTATVGHGGLCRVKDEYRVIIDKRASAQERAMTLAQSLAALDTDGVRMHARVRELIDYYARREQQRAARARPATASPS